MFLIFQSIVIYGFIIAIMMFFNSVAYRNQYPHGLNGTNRYVNKSPSLFNLYYAIPIIIYSLFASIRYRVGVDCESYKGIFYELIKYGDIIRQQEIEIMFRFLVDVTHVFTNKHYLLLFIIALLQLVLYYSSFKKESYVLVFFPLALFLSGEYWSWMNGMRQIIAACFFVSTIPFIINKKWHYFILIAFVASLMHRSALAMIPIGIVAYFLRKNILSKYLQWVILLLCLILMNKFNPMLDSIIAFSGDLLGYNDSTIDGYLELDQTSLSFGVRTILLYSAYIIVVAFSDKLKRFYSSEKFNICYNLFFISICLTLLFYNNFTMIRILYYLTIFIPAVLSYALFYLYYKRGSNLPYMIIIILLLLVRTLYNFYSVLSNLQNECVLYKFDI